MRPSRIRRSETISSRSASIRRPATRRGRSTRSGFDFQRSTADNPLDAHRGYQLAFHTESAGRLLPGTFNYFALSVDGRHYLPIGNRIVVANRLQVGIIDDRGR